MQANAPWPVFRRDQRNSGRSPIAARYCGDQPWSFQTGKGIFSTPVIDCDDVIYIGSADHNFYAINPDGSEKWRFQTGEIIDSAGALPRIDPSNDIATIVFPSGDGYLRCLRTQDGSLVWSFDARVSPRASYNNWFEGNVAIGPDGTFYAGNTNFNYYAVNPDGSLRWTYPVGSNAWSMAAFAQDGTIFWASTDTRIRAISPDGREKWSRRTWGFVSASVAIGTDGTLYIGSFDSYLYALDPDTGKAKWKFKTNDHIYATAALDDDADGETCAIYIGSTDGSLYALDPSGALLWKYDAGAPIRSSPVLGQAPEGESGKIVYFGCGNGRLYALNTHDGTRRWSFDTTPDDPELGDRNDLNGSPALGKTGIYVGGEHGYLWYVPYDYCLHVPDKRGSTDAGEEWPDDFIGLRYVTPGGNTKLWEHNTQDAFPAATIITLRLVARERGETINARVYNAPIGRPRDALNIGIEPKVPFKAEHSADGRYLHIIPEGFLEPNTNYTIQVEGNYYAGGLHLGNLTLGRRKRGRFQDSFTFHTNKSATDQTPFAISQDEVTAIEWTRLAVPIPPMLPSLNQIGFDYIDWIMGTAALGKPDEKGLGKLILWAIGGRVDENGVLVADPSSDFTLPLGGAYRGNAFILTNQNFTMQITGIPIPFNTFQIRGELETDLCAKPGAASYAETKVLSIPTFGPYMVIGGLANNWWEKLLALGTFITRPYAGPANRRPQGVQVASLQYIPPTRSQDGRVLASFEIAAETAYPLKQHRPAILLVDSANVKAVSLDYHRNLIATADDAGNLSTIALTIPAGTRLPGKLNVIVILDVFPMYEQEISG